jgi:RHS repeat-associated protein
VYDLSGRLIAEADDTGQTLREYIWLDDMPLAVVADVDTVSPKLWFVHADHLDRPIRMTDGSQAVVWDAVYRPFGGAASITGSANNNLRFPGQYFLIESGLHYNWYRHYDPTTGRYLQPDPLGFVNGPSLFTYAMSSPTQFIDPEGLWGIRGALGSAFLNLVLQSADLYIRSGGDINTTLYCFDVRSLGIAAAAGFLGPTYRDLRKALNYGTQVAIVVGKEYLGFSAAKYYVVASGPSITIADIFPPSAPLKPLAQPGLLRQIINIIY